MKPAVRVILCVFTLIVFGMGRSQRAPAQPAAPPAPAFYQVALRYRIVTPRDQHVILYDRLVQHLQKLNFEFRPSLDQSPNTDRIDPSKNEFRGRLAGANVAKLRDNPQVAGLVLIPDGFKLPDAADEPVRVRVELVGGLPPDRQRELSEQTALLLGLLGFKEAAGYDHRGVTGQPFTRLTGALPRGQLDVLLKDLRTQPSGWFAPRITPAELPAPLQGIDPIQWTEVLTDPAPVQDAAEPAGRTPEYLDKIGPGLWEIVNDKAKEHQQIRLQAIFAGELSAAQLRRIGMQTASSAFVEGVLGSYVTAQMSAGQVKALAALPEVIGLRLPPQARGDVDAALSGANDPEKVLQLSGLAKLHQQGKRGQRVRLAIVDNDFRGWEGQVKAGKLSAATRLVDLTTERSQELLPAPQLPGTALGHGTQCALAAALAAPAAELLLVRIQGDDPQQLDEANRYFRGDTLSALLERRLDELRVAGSVLALKRRNLLQARKVILDSFRDEEDLRHDFEYLGALYGWIFSDREWHRQQMAYQEKLERELTEKDRRYWAFAAQVQGLQGVQLILCSLTWNDDYPLGAASALSRALDAQSGAPLWFVPAGNLAGQAWTGTFRDADKNGIMEFAEPHAKLPPKRWTRELNFLAWQPHAGKQTADLPAQAALHMTLQWREPHDPDYYLRPGEEDWYRRSLSGLTLTLLRQRDPDAKTLSADAMEIVARSRFVPLRLDHQPSGTVYQQVLDYVVDKPGRYALRIEQPPQARWTLASVQDRFVFELKPGETTQGIRPVGAPSLPGLEKTWELRPRLFVDVNNAARLQGRPVLADFATSAGAVGLPGDARSVITVGAADLNGRAQPYSASGAPPFLDLVVKPTVWTYDAMRQGQGSAWGTSLAASFATGAAATLMSSGLSREQVQELLRTQQGQLFRVP